MQLSTIAATLTGLASLASALKPMTVVGNNFVDSSTNNRFQVVGVAYQPGGSAGFNPALGVDPLSNGDVCLRDAALMQALGVNTIRVYNLDPDLNHDQCASVFNAAGIYMILDVNSPLAGDSLTSYQPWTSYYAAYLNRTFAVVEAFKSYPNTLAFFSGNEVIFNRTNGDGLYDPPYVRAVTRDLKNYISKHADRQIPVGYSAADVRELLFSTWEYLQCSLDGTSKDMSKADLFALNSYSWCGDSNLQQSTYDQLIAGFANSSVPVFFSEYGCNTPAPRIFTEVPAIYGPQMTASLDGGIVYEYIQEVNKFGLVNVNSDGSAQLLDDYYTLQSQYSKLDFKSIQGTPAPSTTPAIAKCDASLILTPDFTNNFTLPVLPPGAQDIINNGVSPAPKGQIVSISSYKVTHTVKDNKGNVINNLAVVPLKNDAINAPGSNVLGSSTSSSSGGPSSTGSGTAATSSNAAPGGGFGGEGVNWRFLGAVVSTVVVGFGVGFMC